MRHLLLILAIYLTATSFGQITEKYIEKDFKELEKQGLITGVWRHTYKVREGFGVDTIQGVVFKLKLYISNEDIVYWVDGVSTTFESIQKVYDITNDWERRYNTKFTHYIAHGAKNLGTWRNPNENDNYNIYEALNHDDPDKPMQIEFSITRRGIQSKL